MTSSYLNNTVSLIRIIQYLSAFLVFLVIAGWIISAQFIKLNEAYTQIKTLYEKQSLTLDMINTVEKDLLTQNLKTKAFESAITVELDNTQKLITSQLENTQKQLMKTNTKIDKLSDDFQEFKLYIISNNKAIRVK